ncbi:unnamed protein product [Timema podura]|uniref:Protein AATF n=1 Tax=Timema podura TaxID=61482 RepID=A0ABN7NN34_TIMPD|nr:unnamed protein product [Timema podura]
MGPPKKTASENFHDLVNPKPLSNDPEDDLDPDTAAKLVDNDYDSFDEGETVLNKSKARNIDLIEEGDERYIGEKVSRKSLKIKSRIESDSEIGSDDEVSLSGESPVSDGSDGEENLQEDSSGDDDDDDDASDKALNTDYENSTEGNNFQHISNKNAESEVEKGNAVRNQLKLWDNLLEGRIKLQKVLMPANKFPQHTVYESFLSEGGAELQSAVEHSKHLVASLLDKLLLLQTEMLDSYTETKNLGSHQRNGETKRAHDSDEEIPSDSEEEQDTGNTREKSEDKTEKPAKRRKLADYSELINKQHEDFMSYRNLTIQKWNDKTRVAVGNLSNRNFSAFEQSTVKQIEQILSNKPRLIRRSQMKRSVYDVLCQEPASAEKLEPDTSPDGRTAKVEEREKEYDVEIFDDTDFYHQLLRELIERKSTDITDPILLGKQWVELQKLRSKMKRKVDTRATKGRKIRYVVHPKLVNFMAPIPQNVYTEESKNELFSSLFGKRGS